MDDQFDIAKLKDVQDYSKQMEMDHSERDTMFDEMERMYHLDWDERDKVERRNKNVKVTIYPGPRVQIDGLVRLICATNPTFTVPIEVEQEDVKGIADNLEKRANTIWRKAGRVQGDPVHYDLIRSAGIYGEVHAGIVSTSDMVEQAKGGSKAAQKAAERAAATTPFLYPVYNPHSCYPDWNDYNMLRFWYGAREVTAGDIEDRFGEKGKNALSHGGKDYQRHDSKILKETWDLEYHHVWIDGIDIPIWQEEHDLPEIPIVAQLIEGSRLFDKPEQQRAPFLYKYMKSGIWKRQNLWLTAFYTILYGIGFTPMFVEHQGKAGAKARISWNTPGGRITVPPGNKFEVLTNKGVLDPSMQEGYRIAQDLEIDTTMYKQVMGESVGKNAPYSSQVLLTQTGRLPLVLVQKKGGWIIGDMMRLSLQMLKEGGKQYKSKAFGTDMVLKSGDIPDHFEIEANLEIVLPQERLQMAALIGQLTGGDNPSASMKYAREKLLAIGQSDEMQEEIWSEVSSKAHFTDYLTTMMQQAKMRNEQAMMQAQQAQMQAQGGMQPGMQPGMEQQQPGMQNVAGAPSPNIPPEMMAGGEIPLEGEQEMMNQLDEGFE